jgi:hypothetical protein
MARNIDFWLRFIVVMCAAFFIAVIISCGIFLLQSGIHL